MKLIKSSRILSRSNIYFSIVFFILSCIFIVFVSISLLSHEKLIQKTAFSSVIKSRKDLYHSSSSIIGSAISQRINHLLRGVTFLKKSLQEALKKQNELLLINSKIRREDLLNRKLFYFKTPNLLASNNDVFGQLVIRKRNFDVKFLKNGKLEILYDHSIDDHLFAFSLPSLILSTLIEYTNLGIDQHFLDTPSKYNYRLRYPISTFDDQLFYPFYNETSAIRFFYPTYGEYIENNQLGPIDNSIIVTPIYRDGLTGGLTFSINIPILDPTTFSFEGFYGADIFLKNFNKIYSDLLSDDDKTIRIIFDDLGTIINHADSTNTFLDIPKTNNDNTYPEILNRIIVSENLSKSTNQEIKNLRCLEKSQDIKIGAQFFIFDCFQLDIAFPIRFVTAGGFKKSPIFFGKFVINESLNDSFKENAFDDMNVQLFGILCRIFLVGIICLITVFFFSHVYLFRFFFLNKLYLKSYFLSRFGGYKQSDLIWSDFESHFFKLAQLRFKLSETSRKNRERIRFIHQKINLIYLRCYEFFNDADKKANVNDKQWSGIYRNIIQYTYFLDYHFLSEIDDLLFTALNKNQAIILNEINLRFFFQNFFEVWFRDSDFEQIEILNNVQDELFINSDSRIFSYVIQKSLNYLLHFFSIKEINIHVKESVHKKQICFELEISGSSINLEKVKIESLIKRSLERQISVQKFQYFLREQLSIGDIKFEYAQRDGAFYTLVSIDIGNQVISTPQEISKRVIYRIDDTQVLHSADFASLEAKNNSRVYLISDEENSNLLDFEREYSIRNTKLIAKQNKLEEKNTIFIFRTLSNLERTSPKFLEFFEELNNELFSTSLFQLAHTRNPHISHQFVNLDSGIDSFLTKNDGLSLEIENSILTSEFNNSFSIFNNLPDAGSSYAENFEECNQAMFDVLKSSLHGKVYLGGDNLFIFGDKQNRYLQVIREGDKFLYVVHVISKPYNFIIERETPLSFGEEQKLRYLANQFFTFQNKGLLLTSNPTILGSFQYFLKKLKSIIYARKATDDKTSVYLASGDKELEKEVLSIPFYSIRLYTKEFFYFEEDDYLLNKELIKKFKKQITDPRLKKILPTIL